MKTIVEVITGSEVKIDSSLLPMLIQGRDRSGASLLSIVVAAQLHKAGSRLIVFTAKPEGKIEFLNQLGDLAETVLFIESEKDIVRIPEFQSIVTESGNEALLLAVMEEMPNLSDYVLFLKNIETIVETDIVDYALSHPSIISGDITKSTYRETLAAAEFETRIMLTPFEDGTFSDLEPYQAKMQRGGTEQIVTVT